jgi:hypothetical protein
MSNRKKRRKKAWRGLNRDKQSEGKKTMEIRKENKGH